MKFNEIYHTRSSQWLSVWAILKREETVAVSKLRASLDPGGADKFPVLFRMADTLTWFPVVFDRMQDMQGQCMWETEVPWVAQRDLNGGVSQNWEPSNSLTGCFWWQKRKSLLRPREGTGVPTAEIYQKPSCNKQAALNMFSTMWEGELKCQSMVSEWLKALAWSTIAM